MSFCKDYDLGFMQGLEATQQLGSSDEIRQKLQAMAWQWILNGETPLSDFIEQLALFIEDEIAYAITQTRNEYEDD